MLDFIHPLKDELEEYQKKVTDKSILVNMTGYYYHENYHSDILATYLQYESAKKHFINWLNDNKLINKIKYQNYTAGKILRESGRVDVTLVSNDEKKAIIIENKSNNAIDQDKQLFRYSEQLKHKGFELEAIFYLNKNSNKTPVFSGLNKLQKESIMSILTIGQLVGVNSFTSNVIDRVILETTDIRLNAFSQELKELFKYIVYGGVNMEHLEEFEKMLSVAENYKEFRSAVKAYNDMPYYLAEKYKNLFIEKGNPLKIWLYKPECLVFDDIKYKGHNFAIDVWFHQEEIDISILDRHENYNFVEEMKKDMGNRFPFQEKLDEIYHVSIDNPYDSKNVIKKIEEIIRVFI